MTRMNEQADQPTALIVPTSGLPPLPPSLWRSWEVRQALGHGSPGTIVAIARRAHGLRQDELGTLAGFSQSAISRLEAGSNLAYDTRILRALQRLLGIPPHLLGLADDTVTPRPADVPAAQDRSGAALWTALAFGEFAPGGPAPAAASAEVVTRLLVARRIINDADSWRATAALKPTTRQLYELTDQLRRTTNGPLRRQLLGVQALYAEFYGWLHEETGNLRGAHRWTTRALQQGQAAEDADIVAYSYVRLSQLAEADDPDQVIGLARAALREDSVRPRIRALALQQQARGHASTGNERACLAQLDEAVPLLAGADPTNGDEYEVGRWFDLEHLGVQRAACLLRLGRSRDAIAEYERVRPRWSHICLWQQGVHTAKLAVAHAVHGDYDHAAALAHQALVLADRTEAVMIRRELRNLRQWAKIPALAEITEALQPAS